MLQIFWAFKQGLGLGQDVSFCVMEAVFCQLHETPLLSPTGVDKLHGFAKCERKTCHSFTATKISASANLPNPPLASEAGVAVYRLFHRGAGLKETVRAFPSRAASCCSASGTGMNLLMPPSALHSRPPLFWLLGSPVEESP